MCKTCCRDLCYKNGLECVGHKFLLERRQRRSQKMKIEASNGISDVQMDTNNEEMKHIK